jgi:predicted DCC family thiol-disulfide oxidoreductase YuxK
MQLTIFYDSQCPLCMQEMQQLKTIDQEDRIQLVDLHTDDLNEAYPNINKDGAMKRLHGQLDSGEMLYGLDVTCRAWSLVGKHRWLAILRWPLIKPFADLAYRIFARHRGRIAFLITGKTRCSQCAVKMDAKI